MGGDRTDLRHQAEKIRLLANLDDPAPGDADEGDLSHTDRPPGRRHALELAGVRGAVDEAQDHAVIDRERLLKLVTEVRK